MPFPREARHHLQEVQGEGGACQGDGAQPAPEQQLQPGAQQPGRRHCACGAAVLRGRDRGECGRDAAGGGAVLPPEVKCAGAGRCSRPLGGPGAEEGAPRAGPLPSSGRWSGWAPAWLPPWSEPTTPGRACYERGQSLGNAHRPLLCFQRKTKVRKAAGALSRLRGCTRRHASGWRREDNEGAVEGSSLVMEVSRGCGRCPGAAGAAWAMPSSCWVPDTSGYSEQDV